MYSENFISTTLKSFAGTSSVISDAIPASYDLFLQTEKMHNAKIHCSNVLRILFSLPSGTLPKSKSKNNEKLISQSKVNVYDNMRTAAIVCRKKVEAGDIVLGIVLNGKFIDLRQNAGVLQSFIESKRIASPEQATYSPISYWNGTPMALGTTIVIELPERILSTLEKVDIQNTVSKYIAAGIYPLLRIYKEKELGN